MITFAVFDQTICQSMSMTLDKGSWMQFFVDHEQVFAQSIFEIANKTVEQ